MMYFHPRLFRFVACALILIMSGYKIVSAFGRFGQYSSKYLNQDGLICEYIINSMPISSPPFSHESLMEQCRDRFAELMHDHRINIEKTASTKSDTRQYKLSNVRKNLFVLDLDESIIFQRESAPLLSPHQIKAYNSVDLKFSIFPCDQSKQFIVYRPYPPKASL